MSRRICLIRTFSPITMATLVLLGAATAANAAIPHGDMNCDGVVNGTDIPLFVNCLLTGNCNTGLVDCDGNTANGCETNTNTSPNNCGSCGNVCSLANATSACVNGVCTIGFCDAGFADCNLNPADGCEVFLFGDPAHCNGCNTPCPAPPNAVATCEQGICGFECIGGYGNCDGNPANGCETDLATDISHCGACGSACFFANATGACNAGACVIVACNPGFANCDGNPANGCETNTNTSVTNCGNCGLVCNLPNAVEACVNGVCVIAGCNGSFGNCDGITANGCETNLATSVSNCGGCGIVCPNRPNSTPTCVAGACSINCNTGFRNCDGILTNGCEINILTDSNNCGNCGVVCPTGQTCINGVCQ